MKIIAIELEDGRFFITEESLPCAYDETKKKAYDFSRGSTSEWNIDRKITK